MITIIEGPQGSGKTTKANTILAGKKHLVFYEDDVVGPTLGKHYVETEEAFKKKNIPDYVQYILIEGVTKKETMAAVYTKQIMFPKVNFIITMQSAKGFKWSRPDTELIKTELF